MTRRLAEMTWPDVAAAVAAGATTVILPLGATEQHGHHLPLGTDTFRAAALADRLAEAAPRTLVAPTLPIGCSDEHHGFAGLLSLNHETLAAVIVDCARRMAGWGVRRLVMLSAHGGNAQALELAVSRLRDCLPTLAVVALGGRSTVSDQILAVAAIDGVSAEAVGLHAGEGETSEMLALHPHLVHTDRAVTGYCGSMAGLMPRLRQGGLRAVTPIGTLGDAADATAARGARYLAIQTEVFRQALAQEAAAEREPVS